MNDNKLNMGNNFFKKFTSNSNFAKKNILLIIIAVIAIISVFMLSSNNNNTEEKTQDTKTEAKTVIFDIKPLFNPLEKMPSNINLVLLEQRAPFIESDPNETVTKMLVAIREGVSVPQCTNKNECTDYCRDEQNYNKCVDFANSVELITGEEATMALVIGPHGPGNCTSEEQCATYCQQEENKEECLNFAKEKGLIMEVDENTIKDAKKSIKKIVNALPKRIKSCLKTVYGKDALDKVVEGELTLPTDLDTLLEACDNAEHAEDLTTDNKDTANKDVDNKDADNENTDNKDAQ